MGVLSDNAIIGASNASGYDIDNSLRFDPQSASRLERQEVGAPTSTKILTLSCWLKWSGGHPFGTEGGMILAGSGTGETHIYIHDGGRMISAHEATEYLATEGRNRDYAAWYHFVVVWDSTDSTAGDRNRIYKNGTRITDFNSTSDPALNFEFDYLKSNSQLKIGGWSTNGLNYWDGYMAEYHVIDGQALGPENFGEVDEDTNQWKAIKYGGSYGANGFYLDFADSSDLGKDVSGNGNDFTATNLAAYDQMIDTPTNNFATLNRLQSLAGGYSCTMAEGNLKNSVNQGGLNWPSTFAVVSAEVFNTLFLIPLSPCHL